MFAVTPTPRLTMSQLVLTPVGALSVFGFKTPIPHPFGMERSGSRHGLGHRHSRRASRRRRRNGRDVPRPDWPRRHHSVAGRCQHAALMAHLLGAELRAAADGTGKARLSVAGPGRCIRPRFHRLRAWQGCLRRSASTGRGIGCPSDTYRRSRIESGFGRMMVTHGHLPNPDGRETTGYEVSALFATFGRAKSAGAVVLVEPYSAGQHQAAIVQFPGGQIAEIRGAMHE